MSFAPPKSSISLNSIAKSCAKQRSHMFGFTILELMISLGMLGVITALAAPNLSDFYNRQKINAKAESISSALSLARSAALTEATTAKVCWNPSAAAITVDGYSIAAGNLAVLTDADDDNVATAVSEIQYSDSVSVYDDEGDNCAEFTTDGRLDIDEVSGTSLVFAVCKKAGETEDSRAVIVSQTGRASVADNVNGGGAATLGCS